MYDLLAKFASARNYALVYLRINKQTAKNRLALDYFFSLVLFSSPISNHFLSFNSGMDNRSIYDLAKKRIKTNTMYYMKTSNTL